MQQIFHLISARCVIKFIKYLCLDVAHHDVPQLGQYLKVIKIKQVNYYQGERIIQ